MIAIYIYIYIYVNGSLDFCLRIVDKLHLKAYMTHCIPGEVYRN